MKKISFSSLYCHRPEMYWLSHTCSETMLFGLSVLERLRRKNGPSMKTKHDIDANDEMREEYDFASMKGGVRGKYTKAFEHTAPIVLLDSDVAEIFPDSRSVNEALLTLALALRKANDNAQQ
jgi:hypothetical protein